MTAPSLLIFDCDGVLVDSEPISIRVLLEALRTRGLELDVEAGYDRFLGRSMATICRDLDDTFGVTLADTDLALLRERLWAAFTAELRPVAGVATALARLALPCCVASSSQPERIEHSLRVTGLWPWFEGRAFSATMVARGKPAPDLFELAAASMGHAAGAAVVVEDSPVGIAAAKAAGMRVVGFLGGTHARRPAHAAAIRALCPDALLDDMTELPELLARL